MFSEKLKKKQHKYITNNKNKLKVIAKAFVIASIFILLGVYPINNWIVVSTFSVTEIKDDNNRIITKQQQQEQSHDYCINQEDMIDNIAIDSDVVVDLASNVINPICNYNSSNNTISKKIIPVYSLPSIYYSSSFTSFYSPSKTKKFVHSSIRIEEEIFQSLQKEAERQGISFSSVINKILKNYVTSEMQFEQLGFILISKDLLRKTFAELHDEKRLEEVGRELGLIVAHEYMTYFFPNVNISTLPQFLEIWFRRFQSFKHRVDISTINNNDKNEDVDLINKDIKDKKEEKEVVDNYLQRQIQRQEEIHSFALYHEININFSLVLKAELEVLIEPIVKSPVTFKELTANSISFSFSSFSSNTNNKKIGNYIKNKNL
jgi:hypothetical protein